MVALERWLNRLSRFFFLFNYELYLFILFVYEIKGEK